MPKCENCGDEEEALHYTEWNNGTDCGDLCEVCAEMFINMEDDDEDDFDEWYTKKEEAHAV